MDVIWDRMFGGVSNFFPDEGGPQCFLPLWQRIVETFLLIPLAIGGIIISSRNLEPINPSNSDKIRSFIDKDLLMSNNDENFVKYFITIFYCFVFVSEIIYKLINRTIIFLLNPCHIATIMQLLLLMIGIKNRKMCFLFRFQMYLLPGAVISITFPAVNSRVLPGEVFAYFVQHLLILVVPFFIVYINGTFLLESLRCFGWSIFSYSILVLYNFSLLQILGLLIQVNLDYMLCPSENDPFYGRFYRLAAVIHQAILVPFLTKVFNISIKYVIQAVHSGAATPIASIFQFTKQIISLKRSNERKK